MDEQFAELPWRAGYRVSSHGYILGPRGKPLAGYIDKNGYHCVSIGAHGNQLAFKAHRAVWTAFHGPIPEGKQINHRNGVKNDNRLENLEVVTGKENIIHRFRVLGHKGGNTNPQKGSKHHHSKLTEDDVREIRRLHGEGWTQTKLAVKFATPQTNISQIVRKVAWRHVE